MVNNVPKECKCVIIIIGVENVQHPLKVSIHHFYSVSCNLSRVSWQMPTAVSSLLHLRSSRFFKW